VILKIWQKIPKTILIYNTKEKIGKFWSKKMTKFVKKEEEEETLQLIT
jgi:hypothetical protein